MNRWFAPYAWLGESALARNVTIAAANGVIVSVEEDTVPGPGDVVLAGVALPGMVSAHSHAFHRALRGQTQDGTGDFWTWRQAMYALANRLEPANYRRLAGEVFAEMLRAGITAVGEFHYVHHRPDGSPYDRPDLMELAVIGAALDTGMRLTLIDSCYLYSNVDGAEILPEQRRFSDGTVDRWSRRVTNLVERVDHPTVKIGVAAHSVRALSPTDLAAVVATAGDLDAPLHVHVSEQRAENEACVAAHGVSPIRLLADVGFLGPDTTLVHATHIDEDDRALVATTGTGVCFCPTTERDLGDGLGPARELRDNSVMLSLGTDANVAASMFEEARGLEYHDRLRLERRGIHSPIELLESATVAGLAALGWGHHAPLAVGMPADFVAVNLPLMPARDDPPGLGELLFAAQASSVTDVVVAGVGLVREGQSLTGHSAESMHQAILGMAP